MFLAFVAIFSFSNSEIFAQQSMDFGSGSFQIDLSQLDPIDHGVKTSDSVNNRPAQTGWKGLFLGIMNSISNLLLTIIPLLAGVALIIAGYFYIFSFSDGDFAGRAKNIIKYNLIAILVAFLSWVIISVIASFFS